MDHRPKRKKTIPLKLQDSTFASKPPAKSKKMEIDNIPEERKIKTQQKSKSKQKAFSSELNQGIYT